MIIPILLLLSLGITVIFTSDQTLALQQVFFSILGIGFFYILRSIDYRALAVLVRPMFFIILFLLAVIFFLGFETRGSIRWIPLGPFNFQPSEFAKPVVILTLAYFWSKHIPSWKNIFLSLLIIFPVLLLIFKQPDLGTTMTVFFIWLTMLIASNITLVKIAILSLMGLITAPLSWFVMHDYQKQRIISFLSPYQDPQGIGFQVIQSTIAVGSGQLFGRGLGRGTQSRLQFLPEFRTDFIFAFIAEELGFLGSLIVILLYSLLFFLMFKLLFKVNDRFGELILIGVLSMVLFQICVNIGMNTGILPITGITLPLLSYGGSSILTTLISFGLIASVAKHGRKSREVENFDLI